VDWSQLTVDVIPPPPLLLLLIMTTEMMAMAVMTTRIVMLTSVEVHPANVVAPHHDDASAPLSASLNRYTTIIYTASFSTTDLFFPSFSTSEIIFQNPMSVPSSNKKH